MDFVATTKDAYRLFHEGILCLSEIEQRGIRVDMEYLHRTHASLNKRIAKLEQELKADKVWKEWKRRFGGKSNLNSATQRGVLFFDVLGYKSIGQTADGRHKADEEAFADIDIPFVQNYFKIQKLRKANSTYINGLIREQVGGILRCSYSLAGGKEETDKGGALSFRGSSSDPNFQNYPIRDEEQASLIRQAFLPRDRNHCFVETDFSTLEVRVSACYNKDPVLIRYVQDKSTDMHKDAAKKLFILDENDVQSIQKFNPRSWKMLRHLAKNKFVFPQFYGDYYVACARNIWKECNRKKFEIEKGVSILDHLKSKGIKKMGECVPSQEAIAGTYEKHVQKFEKYFWYDQYAVYTKWKKLWFEKYCKRGWFPLYTGFRCRGVYRKNQVINFPVQGAAFHCLLWCLIRITKLIKKYRMKARIVGQIHDSILGDVPEREVQQYLSICKQVMTQDLTKHWKWIIVPMEMEPDVSPPGKSWHEKKPWDIVNGIWSPK